MFSFKNLNFCEFQAAVRKSVTPTFHHDHHGHFASSLPVRRMPRHHNAPKLCPNRPGGSWARQSGGNGRKTTNQQYRVVWFGSIGNPVATQQYEDRRRSGAYRDLVSTCFYCFCQMRESHLRNEHVNTILALTRIGDSRSIARCSTSGIGKVGSSFNGLTLKRIPWTKMDA